MKDHSIKQYIIDFAEGRLEAYDFLVRFKNDPEISFFLQSIVPEGKKCYVEIEDKKITTHQVHQGIPYDIHVVMDQYADFPDGLKEQLNAHSEICRLLKEAFPNEAIAVSDSLKKKIASMPGMKQYVVDFAEGRVGARDFLIRFRDDSALSAFLQSIAPDEKISHLTVLDARGFYYENISVPFNISLYMESSMRNPNRLGKQLNVYGNILRLVCEAFPNEHIVPNHSIKDDFDLMISACPSCVGGDEADVYIENVLKEIPRDLSKKQRTQIFRDKIKKDFHLDTKRPSWLQEPEWPLYNGKPMKFISQSKKGEFKFYKFQDIETGEECVVKQFT